MLSRSDHHYFGIDSSSVLILSTTTDFDLGCNNSTETELLVQSIAAAR